MLRHFKLQYKTLSSRRNLANRLYNFELENLEVEAFLNNRLNRAN